jgi:hypothetical protein
LDVGARTDGSDSVESRRRAASRRVRSKDIGSALMSADDRLRDDLAGHAGLPGLWAGGGVCSEWNMRGGPCEQW